MASFPETLRQGYFYFDPDDPIYRDHFPGRPVVPGSLIIHAFIRAVRQARPGAWESVENFRFKRFLAPGRYAFEIERVDGGRLACRLFDHDTLVVTGTL